MLAPLTLPDQQVTYPQVIVKEHAQCWCQQHSLQHLAWIIHAECAAPVYLAANALSCTCQQCKCGMIVHAMMVPGSVHAQMAIASSCSCTALTIALLSMSQIPVKASVVSLSPFSSQLSMHAIGTDGTCPQTLLAQKHCHVGPGSLCNGNK